MANKRPFSELSLPPSPVKRVPKVLKQLLESEFPDESSDDEDYKPNTGECPSDEEGNASSQKTNDLNTCSRQFSVNPISGVEEPMSEEENTLVIALPEPDIPPGTSEADKIALRTRSKLCLNDTTLEEIEAAFVAPDMSVDMYNTHCDEDQYQSFLCKLIEPLDSIAILDPADDPEIDPEFQAVEADIEDEDDLCYLKINNDELYGLLNDQLSFLDDEEEEEEQEKIAEKEELPPEMEVGQPPEVNVEPVIVEKTRVIWMTSEERLQLNEQMRMHVQLLSQSYLLSHGNPALQNFNISAKIFLEEIKMFASRDMASGGISAFHTQNLDGALTIVNAFENINLPLDSKKKSLPKKKLPMVPSHVRKTLATNKVFIYPELLPTCGLNSSVESCKFFTTPEDHLLALGLEQFSVLRNTVECIQKYLLPTKSMVQIKSRIKNMNLQKSPLTNPVKFYHVHRQAPEIQRVIRVFDPDGIKAPADYPPDFLPKWMESYSKHAKTSSVTQTAEPSRKVGGVYPKFQKPLLPRKYSMILPRGMDFSSLSQYITPFIKRKYSLPRKIVPKLSSCSSSHEIPSPLKSNVMSSDSQEITKHAANKNIKDLTTCKTVQTNQTSISKKSNLTTGNNKKHTASKKIQSKKSSNTKNTVFKSPVAKSLKLDKKTPVQAEVSDDVVVIEDEHELAATVVISTTIGKKQSVSKKRKGHKRDLKAAAVVISPKPKAKKKIVNKKQKGDLKLATAALSTTPMTKKQNVRKKQERDLKPAATILSTTRMVRKRSVNKNQNHDKRDLKAVAAFISITNKYRKQSASRTQNRQKGDTEPAVTVLSTTPNTEIKPVSKIRNRQKRELEPVTTVLSTTPKTKKQSVSKTRNRQNRDLEPVTVLSTTPMSKKQLVSKTRNRRKRTTPIPTKFSVSEKQNYHKRDLDASLALLQPTLVKDDSTEEEPEVMFANSYLLRATEILKGSPEIYEKFLSTLCKFQLSTQSPVELYSDLKEILKDYPALVRDFIVFLRPEQAKEFGRYEEYIALSKIREFFRKIEIHFKNQPEHCSRILRTFAQLQEQVDITSAEVIRVLKPLLRNQTHLMEELDNLLLDVSLPK